MKRFDKRFIYASLIRDFFFSLTAIFFFLSDFFFGEETDSADIAAVIPFLLIGFGALFLCFVIYRILYYRCSGYLLSDNEIICKRGVLFRKRSVLDYKRIHAINKKQNIIQRILGIAVLTVDSGSANTAHQAEITVIEDSRVVDMLLGKLNLLKEGGTDCETDEPKAEQVLLSESDSLYSFTSGKKMLYTLINIVTTALFTAIFAVSLIALIAICNTMLQLDFLGSLGEFFLYATLLMLGGMLLFSVFAFIGSIINSFIGYYGFKITKHDKSIQITYGLLEKHTNTFALDRIKAFLDTLG